MGNAYCLYLVMGPEDLAGIMLNSFGQKSSPKVSSRGECAQYTCKHYKSISTKSFSEVGQIQLLPCSNSDAVKDFD